MSEKSTDFLDTKIHNIMNIHDRLAMPVKSRDLFRIQIELSGEEARSLYRALTDVITYYEFTKAMEDEDIRES